MRVIKTFEMRKLKHGCGVVAQNLLLNYSLFKITLNPSKKVKYPSEKQKDMSDDGYLSSSLVFNQKETAILMWNSQLISMNTSSNLTYLDVLVICSTCLDCTHNFKND